MGKHTPGPWIIEGESGNPGEAEVVVAPNNRTICWTAASLDEDAEDVTTAEDRANARLIAAAPEMADALRELLGGALDRDEEDVIDADRAAAAFGNARAALAKAGLQG